MSAVQQVRALLERARDGHAPAHDDWAEAIDSLKPAQREVVIAALEEVVAGRALDRHAWERIGASLGIHRTSAMRRYQTALDRLPGLLLSLTAHK